MGSINAIAVIFDGGIQLAEVQLRNRAHSSLCLVLLRGGMIQISSLGDFNADSSQNCVKIETHNIETSECHS